jgi:ATP-dependent Clp protease, protease subunit
MAGIPPIQEQAIMNSSRHRMNGEEVAAEAAKQFNFLENTLLKHRTLTIFGEINKEVAQRTAEKLLALSFEGDAPITIFIGSPGGHVESGDTIYDIIRFIKPVVRTVGTGWVGSIATHIYLAPAKENRYALPNTRFLIHQPSGGFGGDATDIAIQAREIIKTRERINQTIAQQTGQPLERVSQDTDRDYWMSPEESLAYGLVGKIIKSAAELPG